jgi:hypothetical protein
MGTSKGGKFKRCSAFPVYVQAKLERTSINDLLSLYVETLGLFDLVLDVQDGFRFRGFDVEYLSPSYQFATRNERVESELQESRIDHQRFDRRRRSESKEKGRTKLGV